MNSMSGPGVSTSKATTDTNPSNTTGSIMTPTDPIVRPRDHREMSASADRTTDSHI